MANQELIVMPQRELLPPAEDWRIMTQMADAFAKSGYLKGVTTGFAAVTIMQKGRELGIPPMAALSSIYIVQGKASCSAELMRALILRDQGDDALDIVEMSAKQCIIKYKRRGWKEYRECIYAKADAETAKLWDSSEPWKKTPDLMMLARCTTKVARAAFPDVIGGMYEIEEAENSTLPEAPVRVVEEVKEPLQLNPHHADRATGEIAAKAEKPPESWQLEKIKGYAPVMLAFFGRKIKQTPATFAKADEQLIALDAALEAGPPSGHTPATAAQWQLTMETASAAKDRGREFEIPEDGCSVAELYAAYRKLTHGGLTDAEFMGTDGDALEGVI